MNYKNDIFAIDKAIVFHVRVKWKNKQEKKQTVPSQHYPRQIQNFPLLCLSNTQRNSSKTKSPFFFFRQLSQNNEQQTSPQKQKRKSRTKQYFTLQTVRQYIFIAMNGAMNVAIGPDTIVTPMRGKSAQISVTARGCAEVAHSFWFGQCLCDYLSLQNPL